MARVTTLLPVERFKVPGAVIPGDLEFQFETDLSGETAGLIGKKEIGAMPRGSILINTSRGEVVDQRALADAMETGHIDGAAVDTVSPEPPPPDHPLLNLSPAARDRLILTPHIAGITDQAFVRLLNSALANISRVVSGKPPENVVNGVL